MEKTELKNAFGSMSCRSGELYFFHAASGESVCLTGGDEFVLYLEQGEATRIMPSSAFEFCGLNVREGEAELCYKSGKLTARVLYRADKFTFTKTVRINAEETFTVRRITLENRVCDGELSRGGEGQPVFAPHLWCGIEFPAACNYYEGRTLSFSQAPHAVGTSFCSLPVVYGLDFCGNVSRSFERYIESKAVRKSTDKFMRIYCDWGLHDDLAKGEDLVELTEKMTLENIARVAEQSKKSGVRYDYYLMDAFWFEDHNPYIDFKRRTFPHGAAPVIEALEKEGMKYGLWFDLNCIYAELCGMEKYATLLKSKALCFACNEIASLMTRAIAHQIRTLGVKMVKLDFAYFECMNPAHGHSTEHVESKEKSVANFIEMVRTLREIEPDLKFLCYNGWTTSLDWIGSVQQRSGYAISPYWTQYVDYLYCGDPRPSEIACENLENSLVYYTDAMVRNFREAGVPFASVDDHGTMSGQTSTIYWLGKKLLRAGALMNVMRGGGKLHVYGDTRDFDDDDLKYLGYVNAVGEKISSHGFRTDFIAGDVRRGEPYGYAARGAAEGYAVVLNPFQREEACSVRLSDCGNAFAVRECIRNGEITEREEELCADSYTVRLAANGYVLIQWRLLPAGKSFDKTSLVHGDKLSLDVKGKRLLLLNLQKNGKPLRTPYGRCEGLRVWVDGKERVFEASPYIWSGVSWLCIPTEKATSVEIGYEGAEPVWLKYQLTEAEE